MKCPKCGYERQGRDNTFVPPTECPACGVIYSKHDDPTNSNQTPTTTAPRHLRPSPVDPQSLLKARERVENRLRKRLKAQVHDERHAQTLELAKRLTTEQIKKRREKWHQSQKKTQPAPPAEALSEPDNLNLEQQTPAKEISPIISAALDAERQTLDTSEGADKDMAHTDASASRGAAISTPTTEDISAMDSETAIKEDSPAMPREVHLHQDTPTPLTADNGPVPTGEAPFEDTSTAPRDQADEFFDRDQEVPSSHVAAMALGQVKTKYGSGLTRLLPIVAWLILLAGVIGAVLSWITITDVEAGVRIAIHDKPGSLPLGLLLGFAYLATGILGFAFFWVSSLIAAQLRDIRQILLFPRLMGWEPKKTEGSEDIE